MIELNNIKNYKDIRPKWVLDLLEEEIKKTIADKRDFNSVRAMYLFMQADDFDRKADEYENKMIKKEDLSVEEVLKLCEAVYYYRRDASYRRCDAYMVEDVWRENRDNLATNVKKKI